MNLIGKLIFLLGSAVMLIGCGPQPPTYNVDHVVSQTLASAINHQDRPTKDKSKDHHRKPAEILEFFGLEPGMTVVEIMAAGGYYAELMSRVVGANGTVYMQNNQKYYEYQTDLAVNQRLEENRLPNVNRWDKELDDLQLPEGQLDAAFLMLVFHDFYWMTDAPESVIKALFKSLKPGGTIGLVDHAAEINSGNRDAMKMQGKHRIEEAFVIDVFKRNGFELEATNDLLRNSEDDLKSAFFDDTMKGKTTDRFVLKFIKPDTSSS